MVISKVGNFEIEATTGATFLVASFGLMTAIKYGFLGGVIGATLIVLSLLFHEFGHMLAARLCGVRVKAIGLCLKGAYLRRRDSRRAHSELLIAMAGPLASILAFLLLKDGLPLLHYVAQLNLVLGIANLIPISHTDGSRILDSLSELMA